MESPLQQLQERKPFKIRCSDSRFKGVVARSLAELKQIACEKFRMNLNELKVYLHEDGTEVDDDEYFQFLPRQSKFVVSTTSQDAEYGIDDCMKSHERCEVEIINTQDFPDGGPASMLEPQLRRKIISNPLFYLSMTEEQLEEVVSLEPEDAMRELKKSKDEIMVYQDCCEQELKRRTELREAQELMQLYIKAKDRKSFDE